jgi:TonB family protein
MNHWAMVEFTVRSDGRLTDPKIVDSSGDAQFDATALRNVPHTMSARPAITADGKVRDDAKRRIGYGDIKKRLVVESVA